MPIMPRPWQGLPGGNTNVGRGWMYLASYKPNLCGHPRTDSVRHGPTHIRSLTAGRGGNISHGRVNRPKA